MNRIEDLLRKEIGLDAASIGSSLIERTVRLRMKCHGLKRASDYEGLLETSRVELHELIEAVVVRETWFFRDLTPFQAFARLALEWLAQHPSGTMRILSVPCSSGEEPFSLVMALLDANIPRQRFVIHAVDISTLALVRARQATYGRNSFRGKELGFRDRHFHQTKDGYALNPRVRECVQFRQENLLDEHFLATQKGYDFVFCRNLLIYFDHAAQFRALARLHQLLALQGLLFVGPAELPLVIQNDHGFINARLPMAFACRKAAAHSPARQKLPGRPAAKSDHPPRDLVLNAPVKPSLPRAESAPKRTSAARIVLKTPSELEAARQLADAGRLKEAATVCETHLEKEGPSAEAYYLLGLVRDAGGDPQAIECYRRALYLEPNHYETLLQMALLLEKTGDPVAAQTFKRRARRVQQRT